MIKNRITVRLTFYFTICLLVFSVIMGSVFLVLFRNHTINIHKQDMEQRATQIATTLSKFSNRRHGSSHGYSFFLSDYAPADIWVVNTDLQFITTGHHGGIPQPPQDLPDGTDEVIQEVFLGKASFSENFSVALGTPTLTIGTPIFGIDGIVSGVVLLHSPVEGLDSAIQQGLMALGSGVGIALAVCVLLASMLSVAFTKPLNKMNATALRLADGDYTAKNNLHQRDEIGQLSSSMDLLAGHLQEAGQKSEKLEQLRNDFISNISHELRTPVTVIRGSLEALRDGVVSEPDLLMQYYEQMLAESGHLERLIRDLLDLSRLQNPDFSVECHHLNLCEVLDDATRSAEHIAAAKNVRFQLKKNVEIVHIIGDYGRLRQLFLILLDNAIKFSPENGNVNITMHANSCSIRDYGPGIIDQDLPHIFDRFYKIRSEQNKTGTGLGLAIAKQIAEKHQFSLSVQTPSDGGACFEILFSTIADNSLSIEFQSA